MYEEWCCCCALRGCASMSDYGSGAARCCGIVGVSGFGGYTYDGRGWNGRVSEEWIGGGGEAVGRHVDWVRWDADVIGMGLLDAYGGRGLVIFVSIPTIFLNRLEYQ